MLLGIQHDLKDGETVTLTLTFEKSGTMDVVAPVQMLKD
jgi:copper(I)-binding protein